MKPIGGPSGLEEKAKPKAQASKPLKLYETMIAGKRSPFGPKVELLVVLPQQARHPIPLLSPILAHRTYASANEKESTGGRLASDHNYEALRAAAALARPPRNGLGVT